MGNSTTALPRSTEREEKEEEEEDIWWSNGRRQSSPEKARDISLNHQRRQQVNEFKFEMERKHEKRKEILATKKREFEELRETVRRLAEENASLKADQTRLAKENVQQLKLSPDGEELDKVLRENALLKNELATKTEELQRVAHLLDKNRELRLNIAEMQSELQNLNTVVLEFEKEREEYKAHVTALKDVIHVSKKMLLIRESQLKELREKVESIEQSLSGKEMNLLSQDLRMEYERQLLSIRNLRTLYEERQRSDHREKTDLRNLIEDTKKELESERNKNQEAEERIAELETLSSNRYDQIKSLESNLGLAKAESRQYQAELTVINQLFSEILLGFNSSQEIDLDQLTRHLEENHALLQAIVSSDLRSEATALPKVLLDLVHQAHTEDEKRHVGTNGNRLETVIEESESQTVSSADQINSVEEIIELLPKVWRVLIELLSHHKVPENVIIDGASSTDDETHPCYKTVQTPKGPSVVLSVSQTFIRLKDLILEKKSLEKETGHLKQLNTHLETRLQDQEKRLETVSNELNETWHVVGKLQKEHRLLHTQEKILRYELAQKRKLLKTLREELEYSREKWQEAREKNSKTEKQWKQLRVEFASRRTTTTPMVNNTIEESNNSQESGYSDEEPGYETDLSECAPKQEEIDLELLRAPPMESRDDTDEIKTVSRHLVSSVIDEAVANILQNVEADTNNARPSTSSGIDTRTRTLEEHLAAKDERLKRLEGQAGKLMKQVVSTSQKSQFISNKLDNLHDAYGGDKSENTDQIKKEKKSDDNQE